MHTENITVTKRWFTLCEH